ncbi:hypothetical protein SKAU_G00180010 [Synaphobranchus kaupii]|uniref:Glycine N-acyltransferase-like protein n=1 Tax=Synaphobranchus kaupii TaxID=118154 RepID=A0A9Q1FM76_SYNKA|nr:hypothetical protein SKAU_G00180010 [Synaphobranchus kaupii]
MKVLTGDQLKTAEIVLKAFFPQSHQVYGCIFLINRTKSDPVDVLVDNWPDFTTILCLPQNEKEGDLFKPICIFTKDEPTLWKILGQTEVLPWQDFFFIGLDLCHEDTVKCVAGDRRVSVEKVAVTYQMRLQDPSHLFKGDSSPPLRLSSLDESHVDLVNRTWKFGQGALSVRMIRDMICSFPSCCLLDEEGKAVAWILTYATCALGLLYTAPEYRGRGYAKILISTMATRLHAQGYPVYCFIEEENHLSYKLFKKLGFTEDPSYRATWFRFNKV